jgi:hypothetical protein
MMEVWWELHNWIGDGDRWPPSFASLSDTTNTSIFVCPYTGHKAGSLTNVEEWTDYIYIGGASEGMCDVALLICPPENHGGKYGHVLWHCGWGRDLPVTLPAAQIQALIREPWCRSTSFRGSGFDKYETRMQIRIPERLRPIYGPSKLLLPDNMLQRTATPPSVSTNK